jgi:two-component system LytT family sensor kinase
LKKLTVQIVIHIAAWLCFLLLPVLFYPRPREVDLAFFEERYFTTYFLINNGFLIAFYYLNTYAFIPRLFDQKKFLGYAALILALLIFFCVLPRIYHGLFPNASPFNGAQSGRPPTGPFNPGQGIGALPGQAGQPGQPGGRQGPPRVRPIISAANLAVFLMVFVFSTGIRVINQWLRSEQRNKEIANEKLKAELSFLKAQINPHFLFNTLNNIYALASAQSEQTAAAIMKLSSIMRYVLTEARNDLVPLEKEILFTSHYIELQKMRLTDKTVVDFSIRGEPLGHQIAPLLLLPFVENAFKYGISTRERSPINILLEIQKDSLNFKICNQKHLNTMLRVSDNTGIGISNTKRRLDLFYEDRYSLEIDDKANEFSVHLKIPL